MAVAAPVFALGPLLGILIFGGGLGLPLGIPPAPEDPMMARVAPKECLFYTTWSGMAKPDPQSPNHTEQLLAEPEVRRLFAEIERVIKTGIRKEAGREGPEALALAEDAVKWAKKLLTQSTVVFIEDVKLGRDAPDVRGGMVVRVGDQAAELKAALTKYQKLLPPGMVQKVQISGSTWCRIKPDPRAPVVTWGVKGRYFIAGLGEDSVEGILKRGFTAVPKWLAAVRKQMPIPRRATLSYLNVKKIIGMAKAAGGPEAGRVIEALGLDSVTTLAAATGLDKEGFVSKTLVGLGGEAGGLFSLVSEKPLTPDDLAPIPRDATIAAAVRIDPDKVLDTILSIVGQIEPQARKELLDGLDEMREEIGIDLSGDVLKPLGDVWCVYNSPGEGGLVFTGLTAVVRVKDRARLAAVNEKIIAAVKAELRQETGRRRWRPRIEQFQFAGQEVYFFNARDSEFPLAPAWCLTEKELIVALFPQNVKAYLSRGKKFESLAAAPEVARLFGSGGGPVALSYCDTPKLFELFYPFVPIFGQAIASELQREGIDVNVSILPSAKAIGRHLRPGTAALRRTAAGVEITSRQTLPGGNLGATAPVMAGILLPATQSARSAARKATSMNNMKQIGLALLNYHDVSETFPPAYTTNKDGKPLLSWRVQVLPYIEQKVLYERFHLDEPWDSEHNKRLIPMMPEVYKAPGSKAGPGMTNYLTVRGQKTAFPGKEKIRMVDISDGTSNTIMVVEASDGKAVLWTRPDDYQYDQQDPAAGLAGLRRGGFNALFCDGSVRFIRQMVDADVLNALFTRNGGEAIPRDALRDPDRRRGPRSLRPVSRRPAGPSKPRDSKADTKAPF